MLEKIILFFKKLKFFTTSYSINIFPEPLTKEDEERYIKLSLEGDKSSRDKLIEHNLRLVAHIVKKYDTYMEDNDDLISIGTIGLNISINDCIGYDKDGEEITFIDILKENNKDINDIVHLKNNVESLKNYINILNEREKEIIKMRYGILGSMEYTQKEIAKKLKISRSYVSRIEKRALVKMLREFIKDKGEM